jgi:DNA polymerase-4
VLADQFGESGCHLWQLAHGRDERKVVPDRDAKSLSTETTFAQDVGYRTVLRAWLLELVDHLGGRLRHEGLCARTVEVKVRSTAFQTRIRSVSLAEATQATEVLWQAARTLLERCVTPDMLPVRLIGVAASNLTRTGTTQGHLFEEATRKKHQALDRTVDAIRRQLGRAAIQRGSRLDRGREPDC